MCSVWGFCSQLVVSVNSVILLTGLQICAIFWLELQFSCSLGADWCFHEIRNFPIFWKRLYVYIHIKKKIELKGLSNPENYILILLALFLFKCSLCTFQLCFSNSKSCLAFIINKNNRFSWGCLERYHRNKWGTTMWTIS